MQYARVLGLAVASLWLGLAWAQSGTLDDAHKFVSRPDIEAPNWRFTKNDIDKLSPGYWFVSPYDFLDQSRQNGGKWTAPMIFDAMGELVWSGSYLSQQYDVFDFKLSNVLGEDMLTMIYPRNLSAFVIDSTFKMRHVVPIAPPDWDPDMVNMHDFTFSRDGTRAMYFYDEKKNMSTAQSTALGFSDWDCSIRDNCLRELDVANGFKQVFEWCTSDHLDFAESRKTQDPLERRCADHWDAYHVNSADKFPDGGWLMSARHSDTLYKIAKDGSLAWRLGGDMSDFQADFKFSRQHDGRVLEQNSTHSIISLFDNAKDEFSRTSTYEWSRGLIVAVQDNVTPKIATLLRQYAHPRGRRHFTEGRANTQVLPNGNVFICWVNGLLQSEYSPDGQALMVAKVKQEWLKSYRSYKFEFVGRPHLPPDAYAETVTPLNDTCSIGVSTSIFASWNGATEVYLWNVYRTDKYGHTGDVGPTVSQRRTGFETQLTYPGFSTYLIVEAIDQHGNTLGRSNVITTVLKAPVPGALLAAEANWLQTASDEHTNLFGARLASSPSGYILAFAFGIAFAMSMRPLVRCWRRRGVTLPLQKRGQYHLMKLDPEGGMGMT